MAGIIYLDNGNVSQISEEVLQTMEVYYREKFGVPGGEFGHVYEEEAAESLWKAREAVAASIGARPEEIIFTSGVTESNNLAIKGLAWYMARRGPSLRIITSQIERRCILNSVNYLDMLGHRVHFLGVDREGFLNMNELQSEIAGAHIISVQHANQEVGTIQDIKAVGEIAEDAGVIFHTDATHTFLKEKIDLRRLPVDLMSISGHTVHAPLGTGALFVREGVKLDPLFHGDAREQGFRAGHPNMPAIMGFATAVREMNDDHITRMKKMRDYLMDNLLSIVDAELNGPLKRRTPDNVNISFMGVEGEAILMLASSLGLIIRTGSACFSPELKYSYIIKAMGGNAERANSSTRFTLSRYNTMDEMKRTVEIMEEIVDKLRDLSPLYRK